MNQRMMNELLKKRIFYYDDDHRFRSMQIGTAVSHGHNLGDVHKVMSRYEGRRARSPKPDVDTRRGTRCRSISVPESRQGNRDAAVSSDFQEQQFTTGPILSREEPIRAGPSRTQGKPVAAGPSRPREKPVMAGPNCPREEPVTARPTRQRDEPVAAAPNIASQPTTIDLGLGPVQWLRDMSEVRKRGTKVAIRLVKTSTADSQPMNVSNADVQWIAQFLVREAESLQPQVLASIKNDAEQITRRLAPDPFQGSEITVARELRSAASVRTSTAASTSHLPSDVSTAASSGTNSRPPGRAPRSSLQRRSECIQTPSRSSYRNPNSVCYCCNLALYEQLIAELPAHLIPISECPHLRMTERRRLIFWPEAVRLPASIIYLICCYLSYRGMELKGSRRHPDFCTVEERHELAPYAFMADGRPFLDHDSGFIPSRYFQPPQWYVDECGEAALRGDLLVDLDRWVQIPHLSSIASALKAFDLASSARDGSVVRKQRISMAHVSFVAACEEYAEKAHILTHLYCPSPLDQMQTVDLENFTSDEEEDTEDLVSLGGDRYERQQGGEGITQEEMEIFLEVLNGEHQIEAGSAETSERNDAQTLIATGVTPEPQTQDVNKVESTEESASGEGPRRASSQCAGGNTRDLKRKRASRNAHDTIDEPTSWYFSRRWHQDEQGRQRSFEVIVIE